MRNDIKEHGKCDIAGRWGTLLYYLRQRRVLISFHFVVISLISTGYKGNGSFGISGLSLCREAWIQLDSIVFSGMTTHLKHLPKGLGKYVWWVWNFRVICESQEAGFLIRDAHFYGKGTKGRSRTGPSSEIILDSSESLIDLIDSHLLAATLCQELW